ncbi:anaerobic ribonucleoside-triphosphate reductase activating protein [Dysgonomonas sp. Marseille-P4677]|uniref:anaerobic ribonucleoside-triphosphate reductase activating protein n=1 Tax=Dysgonomonas sp. Marseille-P4677 TaxID=2364790 RepID=UPI001914A02C|nr:anaerobic ribonucleoside-triphosphate reductase activating protein [Dysgonomonas sp. Marseille-P4677]MBK5722321.1 anaerobic ribonucleoside-triphosphate reductase activating protein [Dysgonomonas sp. Marseille-P4677]
MNKLSILNILHDTTVDGPGFRTAIYGAGCQHQCNGCHNPHSWNIENGRQYSVNELLAIIENNEFANVTFSGGDPLFQVNGFTELARQIKAETNKNIWCYTGFTYEQILRFKQLSQILPFIDVLVDGRYVEALRDTDLQFRGSSNQRIIDVKKSLESREVILWQQMNNFNKQYKHEVFVL